MSDGEPRAKILRALDSGPIDRTDLAQKAGLDEHACAKALGQLLEAGEIQDSNGKLAVSPQATDEEAEPRRAAHEQLRDRRLERLSAAYPSAVTNEMRQRIRTTVRRRAGAWGESPPRLIVECDLNEDAEFVADEIRRLQREEAAPKSAKAADVERLEALLEFSELHGHDEPARLRWNTAHQHSGWTYATRQSFRAGVKRAQAMRGNQAEAIVRFFDLQQVEGAPGSASFTQGSGASYGHQCPKDV